MSALWTNIELRTVPLWLVREQATHDELRRRRQRVLLKEMIKPAIVGAAVVVGFLMQTAGLHWESIIASTITAASFGVGYLVKEFFTRRKEASKLKLVAEGQSHRTSEAIAELDLEERRRIDAKQERFLEMARDLYAQQTTNMQSIIDNQKAIIKNQEEGMKLKDVEIDKRGLQISEMQNQLLSKS